jgi:ribosome-binding protein aMBF1 (putative translation factor)
MPKVSELKTAAQVAAEDLADPEVRREHERTTLAHAVAMRVIGYRIDHGLSQTALARILGMHQPAIARLEAGDHEPSLATLSRLARVLGIEFHIDITPDVLELRDSA